MGGSSERPILGQMPWSGVLRDESPRTQSFPNWRLPGTRCTADESVVRWTFSYGLVHNTDYVVSDACAKLSGSALCCFGLWGDASAQNRDLSEPRSKSHNRRICFPCHPNRRRCGHPRSEERRVGKEC